MNKKRVAIIAGLAILSLLAIVYWCNATVVNASHGKLYTDVAVIPYNKAGLLLGTAKLLGNGRNNPYYVYRVEAAALLLKAGKIKYLIISGDNSRQDYNEPAAMRADLMGAGIDSTVIFLDYAGFRTFDSVVRLKAIFGQETVTIISQPFHNERAIYIAAKEHIQAIGFNAKDVSVAMGRRTQWREKLARVKVVLDYWLGKKPKFLGSKIQVPD